MLVVELESLVLFYHPQSYNHSIELMGKALHFLKEFKITTLSCKNIKETGIAKQLRTFKQEEDSFFRRDYNNLQR